MIDERFAPALRELQPLTERFAAAGHRLFLVGGTVRDLIVGDLRTDFDLDATTTALPADIKGLLHGWADAIWTQGERFGTIGAMKRVPGAGPGEVVERIVEITTHRADAYHAHSRKPDVAFSDDIVADLSRRDFTVNAMALELTAAVPALVDPFDGRGDLAARVLRTPIEPSESFSDDPLRMLRAARFIARYDLRPQPELTAAVASMGERLQIVSGERIRDELHKLLVVADPTAGLRFCIDTGLTDQFLPEVVAVDRVHPVLSHAVSVVRGIPAAGPGSAEVPGFDLRVTRLAALFHDVDDAVAVRRRLQALRHSNADVDAVSRLVALRRRLFAHPHQWSDSDVRRFVHDAGALLGELVALARGEVSTQPPEEAARWTEHLDDLERRIAAMIAAEGPGPYRAELGGDEVMAVLGLEPGRRVGEATAFLLGVRLDEGVIGRPAAALRLREWRDNHEEW